MSYCLRTIKLQERGKAETQRATGILYNNATEGALRSFYLHKHTWKMIDTIDGAKSSAIIYSITETAKANHLHPFRYVEYLLTELLKHQDDTDRGFIEELLPWSKTLPDICKVHK